MRKMAQAEVGERDVREGQQGTQLSQKPRDTHILSKLCGQRGLMVRKLGLRMAEQCPLDLENEVTGDAGGS